MGKRGILQFINISTGHLFHSKNSDPKSPEKPKHIAHIAHNGSITGPCHCPWSVLYVCISIAALQIHSPLPSF